MKGLKRIAVVLLALCALCWSAALAEDVVSTSVVMRVSRLTQDAIVNEGEDLSMEVNMDGVTPTAYQWYFNDAPIDGAVQKVFNIVDAKTRTPASIAWTPSARRDRCCSAWIWRCASIPGKCPSRATIPCPSPRW